MRLIIGGAHNGKSAYLKTVFPDSQILDGDTAPLILPQTVYAINRLHRLIKRWLEAGYDPVTEVLALTSRCPAVCFVCDEVGCGIVPADPAECAWREAVGAVCCALAQRATCVERVFCGIIQPLRQSCGEQTA